MEAEGLPSIKSGIRAQGCGNRWPERRAAMDCLKLKVQWQSWQWRWTGFLSFRTCPAVEGIEAVRANNHPSCG